MHHTGARATAHVVIFTVLMKFILIFWGHLNIVWSRELEQQLGGLLASRNTCPLGSSDKLVLRTFGVSGESEID